MKLHRVQKLIRGARRAAGLTQAELARRARLDLANIANYETRLIPPIDKLERIAKALKKRLTVEFEEEHETTRHK